MTEQEFGRYRLLSLLGRGGMGEVWRAVDTEKEREVALKLLGSWMNGDPQFAERFRHEAALAGRLNSPHIVPIHDYGEVDGRLYIDMPLVAGTDLATVLERGPLPPGRAVEIVAQVARALATAHRAGLVHRDVKPSNVLVSTSADGADHVYLIDFGIARALDGTRLSLSGAVIGTPVYMAPESFAAEADARSDTYALGCVLHETLTGQPPFTAPHLVGYALAHEREPVPRPSTIRAGVPAGLDDVVARAMAKDPAGRYASVTDLATAARAALAPPAVSATPATPQRPVPRTRPAGPTPPPSRRRLLGVVVAGLALVVIGFVALVRSPSSPGSAPTTPTAPMTAGPSAASTSIPPLDRRISDRAGVLARGTSRVQSAIDQLESAKGVRLYVVYVDTFGGRDGKTWADQAARMSQLGRNDIVFAVAVGDRAYGISLDDNFPGSDAVVTAAENDARKRLAADDWVGGAVALADGLRSGGTT